MTTTVDPKSAFRQSGGFEYTLARPRPSPKKRASARNVREVDYRATMIRDMPDSDRPRERLRDFGADALSNQELLAILLRTGTHSESALDVAKRLLAEVNGLDELARLSHAQLCGYRGFGEAKASHLLAAFELGKRINGARSTEKKVIRTPQDVEGLLRAEMAPLEQEHFRVIVLDTKNHVLAAPDVFVGSVNATTIRAAEVFREAVQRNAPSIIIAHNHPSGDPTPSAEDISVTKELAAAGKLLEIALLDHVVVARDGVRSLREMKVIG